MNLNCKRFTLLLFASLAVNAGSRKLTHIQNFIRENYVNILTSTLLRTVETSSPSLQHAKYADSMLETEPKNADLSRTSSQDRSNEDYSRTYSRVSHADSGSRWRTMLDLLKHARSVENVPHGNGTSQTHRVSSSSSALQSNTTTALAGEEVNKKDVPHEDYAYDTGYSQSSLDEAGGSKPFQNRSRRGAFSLLPENYGERQGYFSPTETCRQEELVHVLRPPGCLRRVVRTSSCQGTCHSRSVPHWDIDLQQLRHVAYCTCCKPHQLSYRRTRFRCPGRQRKVLVLFVGVATQCACRPCSEGDPVLQQPYDY